MKAFALLNNIAEMYYTGEFMYNHARFTPLKTNALWLPSRGACIDWCALHFPEMTSSWISFEPVDETWIAQRRAGCINWKAKTNHPERRKDG